MYEIKAVIGRDENLAGAGVGMKNGKLRPVQEFVNNEGLLTNLVFFVSVV